MPQIDSGRQEVASFLGNSNAALFEYDSPVRSTTKAALLDYQRHGSFGLSVIQTKNETEQLKLEMIEGITLFQ